MIVDLGETPSKEDQENTYVVSANIYSEEANDYVGHWNGGTFNNYQEAYDFWDYWEPPQDEIDETMRKERENGDYSHHELEIGVWCDDVDYSLPFMNMTLDLENEKS